MNTILIYEGGVSLFLMCLGLVIVRRYIIDIIKVLNKLKDTKNKKELKRK